MGIRRQAREYALQMLYQLEVGGADPTQIARLFFENKELDVDSIPFANELFEGVVANLEDIDEMITRYSEHWKLSRMAAVDKNILRLAVFELTRCPDIPSKVTINEAVEVAKRFGTVESGAFVNGILDNIAKNLGKQ